MSGEGGSPDDAGVWGMGDGWIIVFFNDVGRPRGSRKREGVVVSLGRWNLRGLETIHPGGGIQKAAEHVGRRKRGLE